MPDRMRMTVVEAAEALSVSDDTIRRGLAGTGPLADLLRDAGHRDNTGRWIIELDVTQVAERSRSSRRRQHTQPQEPLAVSAEAELIRLRARLEVMSTAADSAGVSHKEEIQRLMTTHQTELERLNTAHVAELGRIRADLEHERQARQAEVDR